MEDKRNWALHLINGIEEDTPIKQYMDLDYLLQMLETNQYYVSRKYTFEDALEGDFPTNRVFPVTAVGENIPPQPKQDIDVCLNVWKSIQKNRIVPTSCWTHNMEDRMVMWKNYTPKFGACIKSTVNKVVASIENNDYDIWCGKITYDGYYAQKELVANLFSKTKAYSEEEECRFYFFEYKQPNYTLPYIKIDINPSVMIDEIILSPFIDSRAAKKLAKFITAYYRIDNVKQSKIKII